MIKKYREKPIIVEAVQFDGGNFKEMENFIGDAFSAGSYITNTLSILTPKGIITAYAGDMVIKDSEGEITTRPQDIFQKTYEEVK